MTLYDFQVVLYLLLGVLGVGICLVNVIASIQKATALHRSGKNGPRLILVHMSGITNSLYLTVQLILLSIGIVVVLFSPAPRNPNATRSVPSLVFTWGLISSQACLVVAAEISRLSRTRILRAIDLEQQALIVAKEESHAEGVIEGHAESLSLGPDTALHHAESIIEARDQEVASRNA